MYLVDANIFSELTKPAPEPSVLNWLTVHQSEIFLSTITVGELQSGISQLADGRKKSFLQQWLDDLRHKFHEMILDFDESTALVWGHLDANLTRRGRKIPARDSFLAASALDHRLSLATRNEKDFLGTGVEIVNPWSEAFK